MAVSNPVVLTADDVTSDPASSMEEVEVKAVTAKTTYKATNISSATIYVESGILKPGDTGTVTQAELSCLSQMFDVLK